MCRFFWTPKRVVFWLYLALKCPLFVTFLTSPEIGQKRTLLLKEFPVIFTFRIVFTRHSVAPDWQKVLFFKITIVLTASCQNYYRFEGYFLWRFFGYFWYTHFWPPSILDKIVRISKLLSFWQPHVKITIVLRTSGHLFFVTIFWLFLIHPFLATFRLR